MTQPFGHVMTLRIFIDYRQKQWPNQLVTVEFTYNNKVQTSTKVLLFKANNRWNPYIRFKMRKKGKFKKAECHKKVTTK